MKFHHNWLICLNYMLKYLRLSETKNIYIFFYSFLKNYSISASNIFKGSFLPSLRSSNWGSLMYLFFFTKSTKFFKISYTIHVQPNTQTALMYPTIVIQCGCVHVDCKIYEPTVHWAFETKFTTVFCQNALNEFLMLTNGHFKGQG